jgi:hypothetical protein
MARSVATATTRIRKSERRAEPPPRSAVRSRRPEPRADQLAEISRLAQAYRDATPETAEAALAAVVEASRAYTPPPVELAPLPTANLADHAVELMREVLADDPHIAGPRQIGSALVSLGYPESGASAEAMRLLREARAS